MIVILILWFFLAFSIKDNDLLPTDEKLAITFSAFQSFGVFLKMA